MPSKRPRPERVNKTLAGHRWVAAALVNLGRGDNNRRAEHAARTGRHVLTTSTTVDVLEVYCADCRVPYSNTFGEPCPRRAERAGSRAS